MRKSFFPLYYMINLHYCFLCRAPPPLAPPPSLPLCYRGLQCNQILFHLSPHHTQVVLTATVGLQAKHSYA
jgi:hypothetical protein